jgi:hypothetical protein
MAIDRKDPVLEAWVTSGWYPDPANPRKARYYDQPKRIWMGTPKRGMRGLYIPDQPSDAWIARHNTGPQPIAVVGDCRVLGGHGLGLPAGSEVRVIFELQTITVRAASQDAVGQDSRRLQATVPYADVEVIEIGGPGTQTRGGRFYGGGFGVQGAAEGMLIASALNLLTTRTRTDTVICLRTSAAELFLHHRTEGPDALRIRLSQVFNILRAGDLSPSAPVHEDTPDHIVDRLAKLADLLDRGLLTHDEYSRLKAELLST